MASVYCIGSLREPQVLSVAATLRAQGHDVFDCWYAAGREADDEWQRYTKQRNQTFEQALRDHPAQHVFTYDKRHLTRCDAAVLVMPAGKSAHLELGWFIGRREGCGYPGNGFIFLPEEPERFDCMYAFATRVCIGIDELVVALAKCL